MFPPGFGLTLILTSVFWEIKPDNSFYSQTKEQSWESKDLGGPDPGFGASAPLEKPAAACSFSWCSPLALQIGDSLLGVLPGSLSCPYSYPALGDLGWPPSISAVGEVSAGTRDSGGGVSLCVWGVPPLPC